MLNPGGITVNDLEAVVHLDNTVEMVPTVAGAQPVYGGDVWLATNHHTGAYRVTERPSLYASELMWRAGWTLWRATQWERAR